MKVLCILLLVANVLYVGWRMNQQLYGPAASSQGEAVAPPLPEGVPRLVLLSELAEPPDERSAEGDGTSATPGMPAAAAAVSPTVADSAPPPVPAMPTPPAADSGADVEAAPLAAASPPEDAARAAPEQAAAAPTPAAVEAPGEETGPEPAAVAELACAAIGPYRSREDMRAAIKALTPLTHQTASRTEASSEARLYTVFLEPAESEAEAQARIGELESKGITDYFLIRRGEMRNAIQVGTFRSQESVAKRLAELERTGYKAVVVPKNGGREQYWIDVAYDANRESLSSLKARAGSGVKVSKSDCP